MRIYQPILTHKNIKVSVGQLYQYFTIRDENIAVIIHIYVARAVLLLFCDHQDTKSE